MKQKFLLLALLGLFFGTKMYAQCSSDVSITVDGTACPNDLICFYPWNTCTNSQASPGDYCCYAIPTNPGGFSTVTINGSAGSGSDCAALTPCDFSGPCVGYYVTISNACSGISDSYIASYNSSTGNWTYGEPTDGYGNTFTVGDEHFPDISLQFDSEHGAWLISIPQFAPARDDQNAMIGL